ncbi:type II toxin-antitoxin system RelE/ParE family toxin [Rhizobium rhizogenes]|uniref:type II toxin-antitoxin system RelE/ParE family toxin n=1 Tax=Rhizobium rhizogenes TaxID=359 RepID=UPI0022700511|nr:type II toxin-antitoxin system RelE/ParE family toxin [Rhizobium rhizogenes]
MEIKWTAKAQSDLIRVHDFLALVNKPVAIRTVQTLSAAPLQLLQHPRIGERLEEFEPRDVRRIVVGAYEMRYEIVGSTVFILRIWHGREDR